MNKTLKNWVQKADCGKPFLAPSGKVPVFLLLMSGITF